MPFSPIPEILAELRAGRPVVLVDDEGRENEGDLVLPAEKVTPAWVNFMISHCRGLVCLALDNAIADRLQLPLQTPENTAKLGTAFTVTIDAREGTTTGVSAQDRATTILKAVDPECRPEDLARPGHVSPLRACDGGVLVRPGQTEGSVDLARLAGLRPAAVICEIIKDDGTMARLPDLEVFCRRHGFKMCSIEALIRYRRERGDTVVRLEASFRLPLAQATFQGHLFVSQVDREPHVAVTLGLPHPALEELRPQASAAPVLVRLHSECLTGDVFGSLRCDCGPQKERALGRIAAEGRGVFLYLRQEGRGVGLVNKLKAYALQEHGLDTVEANEHLGLPADARHYGVAAEILYHLGVRRVRLLTNNPAKCQALRSFGLAVVERVPLEVAPNEANHGYLRTKRLKLGHLLSDDLFP